MRSGQSAVPCLYAPPFLYTVYQDGIRCIAFLLLVVEEKLPAQLAVSNRAAPLEYHRLTVKQLLAPQGANRTYLGAMAMESLAQACAFPWGHGVRSRLIAN